MDPHADSPARKQSSSPIATILVDTSLLIEQQKRSHYAHPVREALAPYRFRGASSYSKLEFKRAWLQRLAWIHSRCRQPGVEKVLDVQDAINHLLVHSAQIRRVQTCMDAIYRFLEADGKSLSGRAQLARLRAHCKSAVLTGAEAIQQLVTGEFRGTRCVRAEEPPTEKPDGSLDVSIRRCTREDVRCAVDKFFEANKPLFMSIAAFVGGCEKPFDELLHMREHILIADGEPQHLCDSGHCAKLADALIAVDGKDMDEFAANNDREWVPIATAMKKPLVNPVKGTRYNA